MTAGLLPTPDLMGFETLSSAPNHGDFWRALRGHVPSECRQWVQSPRKHGRSFHPNDGQPFRNLVREGLPTNRQFGIFGKRHGVLGDQIRVSSSG